MKLRVITFMQVISLICVPKGHGGICKGGISFGMRQPVQTDMANVNPMEEEKSSRLYSQVIKVLRKVCLLVFWFVVNKQ